MMITSKDTPQQHAACQCVLRGCVVCVCARV